MLERALIHARAALALKECAAGTTSEAERRLLTGLAAIHEGRARAVIRTVRAGIRPAPVARPAGLAARLRAWAPAGLSAWRAGR